MPLAPTKLVSAIAPGSLSHSTPRRRSTKTKQVSAWRSIHLHTSADLCWSDNSYEMNTLTLQAMLCPCKMSESDRHHTNHLWCRNRSFERWIAAGEIRGQGSWSKDIWLKCRMSGVRARRGAGHYLHEAELYNDSGPFPGYSEFHTTNTYMAHLPSAPPAPLRS